MALVALVASIGASEGDVHWLCSEHVQERQAHTRSKALRIPGAESEVEVNDVEGADAEGTNKGVLE